MTNGLINRSPHYPAIINYFTNGKIWNEQYFVDDVQVDCIPLDETDDEGENNDFQRTSLMDETKKCSAIFLLLKILKSNPILQS